MKAQFQDENFEDLSQEKFISNIPVKNDIEEDDVADEVNIDQYETHIKIQKEKRLHNHHFHFHGGNRTCCSAHRRHDPYCHIGSKIRSFENFAHQPQFNNIQVYYFLKKYIYTFFYLKTILNEKDFFG